ncbi:hypothetical protein [Geomicrobium sp. JCM 19039]|uniref:hypothetical protein n=1 Tax=Geomicrobium sp. JCM 19039 TaxID=1460636 RepID=UPI00045F2FF9|nr:hypothetical protein [Geomicrobium sp. JCM 19039]GAK11824.1 hypothetical protein JCM19039_1543 [Geomicrobium sp. JCM 19039]
MSKKSIFLTSSVAALAAGATYLVRNPEKRKEWADRAKSGYNKMVGSATNKSSDIPLEQRIGNPDPMDINDNEMVAEGSTYSVDYYNKEHEDQPKPH